jgi:hypothetical protein
MTMLNRYDQCISLKRILLENLFYISWFSKKKKGTEEIYELSIILMKEVYQ